jgi:hypothetical protein
MQWLLHGPLSDGVRTALIARGDSVHTIDLTDIPQILAEAQKKQWDVITAERALAQAQLNGETRFNRCIVLLLEPEAQAGAVERLFTRYKRLTPGRLYTVTASRVKVRQLPTGHRRPRAAEISQEN